MIPTAEQILSSLPFALTAWTALILAWGIYIQVVIGRMMSYCDVHRGGRRSADQINSYFIFAANLLLGSVLLFEPAVVNFLDAVIVINIFYMTYLATTSVAVCKWWKTIHNPTSIDGPKQSHV